MTANYDAESTETHNVQETKEGAMKWKLLLHILRAEMEASQPEIF